MSHYIYWIFSCALLGYAYSTFAFLVLTLFSDWFRHRSVRYLSASNSIALFLGIINLLLSIYGAYQCATDSSYQEAQATSGFEPTSLWRGCYFDLFISVLLGCIFQLLFISKYFRSKKWASLVSGFLIWLLVYLELFIEIWTIYSGDGLSSSWSIQYKGLTNNLIILFSVVYFVFSLWFSSRKRDLI